MRPEESLFQHLGSLLSPLGFRKCSTIFYLITGCVPFWDGGCALALRESVTGAIVHFLHFYSFPPPLPQQPLPLVLSQERGLRILPLFPSHKGILENSTLYSSSELCLFFPLSANT